METSEDLQRAVDEWYYAYEAGALDAPPPVVHRHPDYDFIILSVEFGDEEVLNESVAEEVRAARWVESDLMINGRYWDE